MTTRVALITGGIGEIGTAICRRMAKDGMRVISTCHPGESEAAAQWREDQAADGLHIDILAIDVSSYEECEEKLTKLLSDYGSVDVIVNCAGITRDSSFKKMQKEQWYDVINVNLNSVFNVTRPLWNAMLEKGFGRVVNISSVNGQRGQFGQANYSAAKAGMHGFTMALAQEGASKGVTVNTVSPGYVSTVMTEAIREDVRTAIVSGIPMGRMATVDEVASAVHFLVADDHEYITGANIPVNGGLFI
ncbi:MAG: acetoacetyl-CoA reductase, partial [Gammaproteobacteria bacterium]|nr:acetoacetyl-CoA reductase [Gammaproteobacteria bacterium]